MKDTLEDIERLETEFQSCQKVLTAFGDEKTNLSRPAVSHHMQILKRSGIVKSRKEGTCIYYYLDPDDNTLGSLITLFLDIRKIMENVPDRSGELI